MKHSTLITTGMIAGLLFTSSGAAMAENKAGKGNLQLKGVNVTKFEQRIQRGVKRGKLTRPEARTARAGVQSLKATIKKVKRDRWITQRELKRVKQKSARLNRQITRLINNNVVAKRAQQPRHFARR